MSPAIFSPAFFVEMGWKSALVVLVALLLVWLLRHRSAADRVFLLRLTVFLLFALPFTAAFGPSLEVEQPAGLGQLVPQDSVIVAQQTPASVVAVPHSAAPVMPDAAFDWSLLLLVAYGLGLGAVLSHLATGIWTLRQWTRAAKPVVHPLWEAAQERASYRTGVRRKVDVLLSPHVSAPLGWRLKRPAILLDRHTVARDEQAEAVLAHEYAHIARADWPMLLVSRLMLALFWFNPLAWLLDRKLAEQSEEAADMQAVRRLDPGAYAQALLSAVAMAPTRALPATPMVGTTGLGRRIHRVLDDGARNCLSGSFWTALAGGGAVALSLAIATVKFVPAPAHAEVPRAVAPVVEAVQASEPATTSASAPAAVEARAEAPSVAWVEPVVEAVAAWPTPPALLQRVVAATAPVTPAPPVAPENPAALREMARREALAAHAEARAEIAAAKAEAFAERENARQERQAQRYEYQYETETSAPIAMGVTPAYMAEMASAFRVRRMNVDDATELKSMNVSPAMVRGIVAAGYAGISVDDIAELAAMAITPAYIRGLAAAGFSGLTIDELVDLKAVGVTPAFAQEARRKGLAGCVEELAELKSLGGA